MKFLIRKILILALSLGWIFAANAQTSAKDAVPKGWHLLDKQNDGFYGISLDKAYQFIKEKKLKSKTIIVAVIDSGVDTTHEDLKGILWHNPGEIPGNGIDDDHNGYVDDVYGWNFLGNKDGKNVEQDSYEGARVYHRLKSKYEGKNIDESTLSKEDKQEYEMWKKAEKDLTPDPKEALNLMLMKGAYKEAKGGDTAVQKLLGKEVYTFNELKNFEPTTPAGKEAKRKVMFFFTILNIEPDQKNNDVLNDVGEYIDGQEKKQEAAEAAPPNYRNDIVKDNYDDFNDRFYGNSDVMASKKSAMHGTHVTGIIGAMRNNGIGIDGIADNVKIMMVRAVPDGDEHDKDIALAIRYAVDNGAKVINMSFGKSFSPEKKWVDEAVKYAESKGVLLVHAAGNDSKDVDSTDNFPCPTFITDGKRADNWISVGASGDPKAGGLVANFSNYGKKEVDVFAPGVRIYSTLPGGNEYGNLQGTSMASPVVAGIAALILEYFPNLTPEQVKMVIEKSVEKPDGKVINPETGEEVNLSDISVSGGIVNAYEAIKLASTLKPGSKTIPTSQPASKKKSTEKKGF